MVSTAEVSTETRNFNQRLTPTDMEEPLRSSQKINNSDAATLLRMRWKGGHQLPPNGLCFPGSSLLSMYLPLRILFTSQPVHRSHGDDS